MGRLVERSPGRASTAVAPRPRWLRPPSAPRRSRGAHSRARHADPHPDLPPPRRPPSSTRRLARPLLDSTCGGRPAQPRARVERQTERDALVHRLAQLDERLEELSEERRAIVDALAAPPGRALPAGPVGHGPPAARPRPQPAAARHRRVRRPSSGRDLRGRLPGDPAPPRRPAPAPSCTGSSTATATSSGRRRPVTALSDAMALRGRAGGPAASSGGLRAPRLTEPTAPTAPPPTAGPAPTALASTTEPTPLDPDSTRTRARGPPNAAAVTRFRADRRPSLTSRPWSLLISPPPRTPSSSPERSSHAGHPHAQGRRRARRRPGARPTTSPTPPPPSRPPARCSTTAPRATLEAAITCAFVADAVADLASRLFGREATWGVEPGALDGARAVLRHLPRPRVPRRARRPGGPRHLDDDFELVQDTFRRFADEKLKPIAEHIHRHNDDIPEDIISGLAEMGAFGLSIPEEYGGYGSGGESEYIGMVVATEELSAGRSAPAARSSPGPRSSPGRSSRAAPRSRSSEWLPEAGHRRGAERRRRHRARLRLRRRRHQGHRHQDRRRLAASTA